jgi:hypothetical protein
MRLINSKSLEMGEFFDQNIPPYAILSHTWGKAEVSFQDMQRSEAQNKAGFPKILSCCEQAKYDGFEWVWVDTCCIDKTSSAELSEAINSMYAWYRDSEVCYALLEDVPRLNPFFPKKEFERARWFRRGWCLQELIAPSKVEFYAADWTEIGTKWSLRDQIEHITGIPSDVLRSPNLASYTIAQKMSWASDRATTRKEDQAYCLLGIFEISMPLLYGEGERAFLRLQEEILRQTEDYSLLLWAKERHCTEYNASSPPPQGSLGVLAPSPKAFDRQGPHVSPGGACDYPNIKSFFLNQHTASKALSQASIQWNPPQMTSRGLRIHMFVRNEPSDSNSLLLWTGCMFEEYFYMCIVLEQDQSGGVLKYGRGLQDRILLKNATEFASFELSELYLTTKAQPFIKTNPPWEHRDFEIILSTECEDSIGFLGANSWIPSIRFETSPCPQGRRHYCLNIMNLESLVLDFRTRQYKSETATSYFTYFTVIFKMAGSFPWCSLESNWKETVTKYQVWDEIKKARETEASDRATGQLSNGAVILVAAKKNPSNTRETKSVAGVAYTLSVTLLTSGSPFMIHG